MHILLDDILLRRPEPSDVDSLYRFRNDWEVVNGLGGFSNGYCRRDLEEWVESHRNRSHEVLWVIAEQETNRCIGHVGLYVINHRARNAEFGILLGDKQSWGKGIGSRVSEAIIDYGFRQLNLHRIYLAVLETNQRAQRLYQRLGFQAEGCWRQAEYRQGGYLDVLWMGIMACEWKSRL